MRNDEQRRRTAKNDWLSAASGPWLASPLDRRTWTSTSLANEKAQAGAPPFTTMVLFVPFGTREIVLDHTYGAKITIRPGG